MKSIRNFGAIVLIALVAVACGKVEKILPKKDGIWKVTSQTITNYNNDVLTSTVTETDSLEFMHFTKEGSGYTEDFQGNNRQNFSWSVDEDKEQITVTFDNGAITYDILESDSKSQSWKGTILTITSGSNVFRTDKAISMERSE